MPVPPPTSATGRPPNACSRSEPEDRDQVADVQRVIRWDRTRCSPRSTARSPGARRGRGSWRAGCRATRGPRGGRRGPPRGRTSQPGRARRLDPRGGARPFIHAPYAIVRPQMQTSLARRQRHRRALQGRSKAGRGSIVGRVALVVLLLFIVSLLVAGGTGLVFAVGTYNHYAAGLPDPKEKLTQHHVRAADDPLRPDRQDRAGAPRRAQARGRDVRPDPGRDARRDDVDRGQGLLAERRLRPDRVRERRHRHAVGPAARRLDHHPAARAGPAPAARGLRGDGLRAQVPRDHPVGPAHERVPGPGRQAADHHGLSQPELLRQQQLRREGRGQGLLRQAPLAAVARPVRDPRRDPAVADEVRPDEERRGDLPRPDPARCRRMRRQLPARRAGHDRDRPAAQLHPRAHEDARGPDRGEAHGRRIRRREGGAGRPRRRSSRPTGRRRTSCGRSARISPRSCARTPPTAATRSTPAGTTSSPRSTCGCRRSPRSTCTRPREPPTPAIPRSVLRSKKIPSSQWRWILGLRGHNIHNAAAGVIDYRTGQVLAYVGSASYTSKGSRKFQPQFDVMADGWRQPGSAIKPIDYLVGINDKTLTAATMFMDVTTDFGGGFMPDPGRQARARAGPPSQRPAVLAEHPGDQGRA